MKWTPDAIGPQSGRTVLVTGANSGIGFETARVLAEKGAGVVLACRNPDKGREALSRVTGDATLMALDLASLESVAAFAEAFAARFDALDLLVNNAGVMVPPFGRTADGFETQFGTNHLGHFALTARLLPMLKDRPGARIVTISSMAHRWGRMDFGNLNAEKRYRAWPAYGQSKLANLLFTYELERRLRAAGAGAIAVAAHPGWTATNLQGDGLFMRACNRVLAMEPLAGALPTLMAATDPDVRGGDYVGPDGPFGLRGAPTKVASTKASHDPEAARRLWEVSEALTGVRFGV